MIERYLAIIEVSQKQAYVFGSNKLAENIRRSAEIWWLTEPEKIQEVIGNDAIFNASVNTVYAGGGHTVLCFDTYEQAYLFNRKYSFTVRLMNPDIEVFLFILPYSSHVDPKRFLDYVCSKKERTQEDDERFARDEAASWTSDPASYAPGKYLNALVEGLERKKALRLASFHQGSFGVENIDAGTRGVQVVMDLSERENKRKISPKPFIDRSDADGNFCSGAAQTEEADYYLEKKKQNGSVDGSSPVPLGYEAAYRFGDLGGTKGENNFLAVVHIDGNGMGARCGRFYEERNKDYTGRPDDGKSEGEMRSWEEFRKEVYSFSKNIDTDFKTALARTFEKVGQSISNGGLNTLSLAESADTGRKYFPMRGIIASGDDICFVTDGRIGIECAAVFLEELSKLKNQADGRPYSASAGVAVVHQKYPFFRAYELAENLCRKAKEFAADLRAKQREVLINSGSSVPEVLEDNGAGICAIDWHLEMGEIGMSVEEIRKNYLVKEKTKGKDRHLEMRPYIVTTTDDVESASGADCKTIEPHRQYGIFRIQMKKYLEASNGAESGSDVSAVLKELRGILKQGETEAQHYIRFHKLTGLLIDNYYGVFEKIGIRKDPGEYKLFVQTADGEQRSVIFDAAETLDVYTVI